MKWDTTQYLKYEKERTQPAIDLIHRIDNNPTSIIDIGCGPGNSTTILKQYFSNANIKGVDKSKVMLEKARSSYPDICFEEFDATVDLCNISSKYDLVFSNACIHWIENHPKLLREMMNILSEGGILAIQIPMTKSKAHQVIYETIKKPKWQQLTKLPKIYHQLDVYQYVDILSDISSDFSIYETTYNHIMTSHKDILEWIKGSALKPYLLALNNTDASQLEEDVLNGIKEVYSKQKNGNIVFQMERLFIVAHK